MAKYLVETYYTCSIKVSHYLDDISENTLKNLEKQEDGKLEILDMKLDNRKTKNLDKKDSKKIDIIENNEKTIVSNNSQNQTLKLNENLLGNVNDYDDSYAELKKLKKTIVNLQNVEFTDVTNITPQITNSLTAGTAMDSSGDEGSVFIYSVICCIIQIHH